MGLFSFFKRTPKQPVNLVVRSASSNPLRNQGRHNMTVKGDGALLKEIRRGLDLVKQRRGLANQAEAIAFLTRSYIAHEERRMMEQGVHVLPKKEQPAEKIGNYASALPPVPKVTLAGKDEVEARIALVKAVLQSNADMPFGLRKDWQYRLEANERLLILLDCGLPMECRMAHGVLVDHRHYYQPAKGKAKLAGRANFVQMDPHTFIAAVGAAA